LNFSWNNGDFDIDLSSGASTAKGPQHEVNQDQYLFAELKQVLEVVDSSLDLETADKDQTCGAVFIVADGVGGGACGEIASREVLLRASAQLVEYSACKPLPWNDPPAMREVLFAIVDELQHHLEKLARGQGSRTMGTTLSLLCLAGETAFLVYVGDSRCYRLSSGSELDQISHDQTEAQRLIDEEAVPVSVAEATSGHILLEALTGYEHEVNPGWWYGPARCGDRFLMCTDGVTGFVKPADLQQILAMADEPEQIAQRLVSSAQAAKTHDDATALVIKLMSRPAGQKKVLSTSTVRRDSILEETQDL